MPKEITMPNLGASSDESRLVKWIAKNGEKVNKRQIIFEAESDKAVVEIEAAETGIIKHVLHEGTIISSGQVVGLIYEDGESISEESSKIIEIENSHQDTNERARSESKPKKDRIFASPLAKKIAKESGIDLSLMKGSGPYNRIIKVDVENDKLNNKKPLPEIRNSETISGVRARIAEKMVQSHLTTVHSTLHSEVSADEIVELRGKLNLLLKDANVKISYDLILAIICAEALQNHPNILVQLQTDQIITKNEINIGIAVDTPKGLMVPVLKKVNQKSLKSLAMEMDGLIDRIKKGKGTVEDFSDGVFTISNLGLYRISSFTPIINYPESAILGIGKITKQPIVRNNQIDMANMMTLSLTYDHRLIDGAPAARFLQLIGDYIESPGLLFFQRER